MKAKDLPERKINRLKNYNYNTPGSYFITICTENKAEILSEMLVGTGVLDRPKNVLTEYGKIADKQLKRMSDFYSNISVDKYVIMPNHIHLLLTIRNVPDGPSGTPVPTNSILARFISTFKRFCNKEYGRNIWQRGLYDHIIRNEEDYIETLSYIENNSLKWITTHRKRCNK
ncbi:MAG: transposase [Clostridia bacterium]|nr:transposase [Clostridia bacterium]